MRKTHMKENGIRIRFEHPQNGSQTTRCFGQETESIENFKKSIAHNFSDSDPLHLDPGWGRVPTP